MGSEGWLGFLPLYNPFLVDSSQTPSPGAALGGYMVFGPGVSCQAAGSRSAPPAACRRLPAAVWGWEVTAHGSIAALSTAGAGPWDKTLKEDRKHLRRFCTARTNPAASHGGWLRRALGGFQLCEPPFVIKSHFKRLWK